MKECCTFDIFENPILQTYNIKRAHKRINGRTNSFFTKKNVFPYFSLLFLTCYHSTGSEWGRAPFLGEILIKHEILIMQI